MRKGKSDCLTVRPVLREKRRKKAREVRTKERRNYSLSSKDGFGLELSLKHSTVTTPRCGRKERTDRTVRDESETSPRGV